MQIDKIESCMEGYRSSKDHARIVRLIKQQMRTYEIDVLVLCDMFFQKDSFAYFSVATQIFKDYELYKDKEVFSFVKTWCHQYLNSWSRCDQFCYRILNPMIETHPSLFHDVCAFKDSANIYMKRAIAVCLIHSSIEFSVYCPWFMVEKACDILKEETHIHIQKGIGWLLKYAYLTYPNEVLQYLLEQKHAMSSVILRYACENMKVEDKGMIYHSKQVSL